MLHKKDKKARKTKMYVGNGEKVRDRREKVFVFGEKARAKRKKVVVFGEKVRAKREKAVVFGEKVLDCLSLPPARIN